MYGLVQNVNSKFPQTSLELSGVIRRRDVSCRRIGALNDRYDWVARTPGVTTVDPNSWIEDWDFRRDGLHIKRNGTRKQGQLYASVCDSGGRSEKTRPAVCQSV
jgi:hypothetical protein